MEDFDFDDFYQIVIRVDKQLVEEDPSMLDQYAELIDILLSYRQSMPYQVFGTIKIDGATLDEAMFDSFFSIKGKISEDTKYNIKFRKEL